MSYGRNMPINALLIIDMQQAYFNDPRLERHKDRLVDAINKLVDEHIENGDLIINIKTVHARDKSTWTLNMLEDNQGFAFEGSDETRTLSGLRLQTAIEITKTRDSAFHGTDLLRILRDHQVKHLTLAGVSAHNCIFQTASDAYAYDFPVRLVAAAIADEDETLQRQAFDFLKTEYRQHID